jgi:hypothetical protein
MLNILAYSATIWSGTFILEQKFGTFRHGPGFSRSWPLFESKSGTLEDSEQIFGSMFWNREYRLKPQEALKLDAG